MNNHRIRCFLRRYCKFIQILLPAFHFVDQVVFYFVQIRWRNTEKFNQLAASYLGIFVFRK